MRMLQTLLDHMPPAGQGTSAQTLLPAVRHTQAAAGAAPAATTSIQPGPTNSGHAPTANGHAAPQKDTNVPPPQEAQQLERHGEGLMNGAADSNNLTAAADGDSLANGHTKVSATANGVGLANSHIEVPGLAAASQHGTANGSHSHQNGGPSTDSLHSSEATFDASAHSKPGSADQNGYSNGQVDAADEGQIGGEVCIGQHLEHSVETCNEQVCTRLPCFDVAVIAFSEGATHLQPILIACLLH